eukprot:SAG31_NODE_1719_length_7455_cov_7.529772_4_plen_57_part_00
MELEDAIHTAILTLKEGFEGQMTENNIEISVIGVSLACPYLLRCEHMCAKMSVARL